MTNKEKFEDIFKMKFEYNLELNCPYGSCIHECDDEVDCDKCIEDFWNKEYVEKESCSTCNEWLRGYAIDGACYCASFHTYTGPDFYCKDYERRVPKDS